MIPLPPPRNETEQRSLTVVKCDLIDVLFTIKIILLMIVLAIQTRNSSSELSRNRKGEFTKENVA